MKELNVLIVLPPELPNVSKKSPSSLLVSLLIFLLFLSCSNLEIPEIVNNEIPEIEITTWAEQPLLKNPVAISHDPAGRLYVTETQRRASEDLDIRRMPGLEPYPWQIEDWSMESTEERRANIKRLLADDSPYNNPWLKDLNGDGAKNWRDLETKSEIIHVLEDTDADGVADESTIFAEGFNDMVTGVMGGVMWHPDGIYATVIPNLWKLQDDDGDFVADSRVAMFDGLGVHSGIGGHDMHGLRVGPDGRIYWTIGDKGINITTKEGQTFKYPNQGVLMRANPDGSNFEVVMHGLRNCQEIDFDDFGNWFCMDNDGDYEGEKERLVYILEGADAGWRLNWQMGYSKLWFEANQIDDYNPWMDEGLSIPHFEGQASYILPPIMNYSDGPCGFIRNPGTALSSEYHDFFFVNHFPGQLLSAFRLEESGAAFKMVDEQEFVKGIMGTGLSFGPEGALYVADWQGGWSLNEKGGIRKIDIKGASQTEIRMETKNLIQQDFAELSIGRLTELMAFPDRRIRLKAQFALAKPSNSDHLISVAGDPARALKMRVHAMWAIGQIGRFTDIQSAIPFDKFLSDANEEFVRQSLKLLGDLKIAKFEALVSSILSAENPRLQLEAGLALGKIGSESSRKAVTDFIRNEGSDPFLRHAGVRALLGVSNADFLSSLKEDPSENLRLAAVVALRELGSPLLSNYLNDGSNLVVVEAARAIHDDFSVDASLEDLSKLDSDVLLESEALFRRVVSANLRLGTDEASRRVLRLVLNRNQDLKLRMEAMDAVSTWNSPAPVDRVVKRFRKGLLNARSDISEIVQSFLNELPRDLENEIAEGFFNLAYKYGARIDKTHLREYLRDRTKSPGSRVSALKAWSAFRETSEVIILLQDITDPELRNEIDFISNPDNHQLQAERLVSLIENDMVSIADKQTAISQLSDLDVDTSNDALESLATSLLDNKVSPELKLDIYQSVKNSNAEKAKRLIENSSLIDPNLYVLDGGHPGRGKEIFSKHPTANCSGCHSLDSGGSMVGPRLTNIGRDRSKTHLLTSLLEPSAEISKGFQLLVLTLKSGESKSGSLFSETDATIELLDQSGQIFVIRKEDIASRSENSVSSMPPMGSILSNSELRDLLSYLSSLR